MKALDWVFAVVLFALGVAHCAFTPLLNRSFSLGAVWFFGAGLAMIFAGMLNIARVHGPAAPVLRGFCMAANLCLLGLMLWFALVASLRRNPQAVVLIVAAVGELFLSAARKR